MRSTPENAEATDSAVRGCSMKLGVIPTILARGYGISFRSLSFSENEKGQVFTFPDEQKRGDLLLGYDEDTNSVFPLIRIDHEVTVCVAFTVYVQDVGWRSIDLTALPATMEELQNAVSGETMQLKMLDPVIDMSGYEIINAWEA